MKLEMEQEVLENIIAVSVKGFLVAYEEARQQGVAPTGVQLDKIVETFGKEAVKAVIKKNAEVNH